MRSHAADGGETPEAGGGGQRGGCDVHAGDAEPARAGAARKRTPRAARKRTPRAVGSACRLAHHVEIAACAVGKPPRALGLRDAARVCERPRDPPR